MARDRVEDKIQRAVIQHFKARGVPDMFPFAIPMGGYRRPAEAAIMSGLGCRAGVPDLCMIRGGHAYFLELKATGGRLSPKQEECLELLERAGATCAWTEGMDAALEQLEYWGLLRGYRT